MVSVLVSFTSVRRRSQHRSAPTSTPERTTLDAPERSCSDLESGLGASPRGFESASSATRMGIKPDTVRKQIDRTLRTAQNRAAEVMRQLENDLGCSKLSALAVRWAAWPDRCSGRSLLVP
jgi:hypothetical protein